MYNDALIFCDRCKYTNDQSVLWTVVDRNFIVMARTGFK